MAKIAVVYFSGYGHTAKIAEALSGSAGAELVTIDKEGNLTDAQWTTLSNAHAIVLGSPTYMGGPAWQFKKFADASSKVWFTHGWKDKLFAGFTNSASLNGDKFSTVQYFQTLALQHGGLWVGTGMMPSSKKSATRSDINALGGFSGLITATPSDASPDEMVAGDLATARAFGERVAAVAKRIFG